MKISDIQEGDLVLIKRLLELTGQINNYVILQERENGKRYIRYAFKEGEPENSECLSWYEQPHPKTLEEYKKRGEDMYNIWDKSKYLLDGDICIISEFTCNGKCRVGEPSKECSYVRISHPNWSKEEPVKCACYTIKPVTKDEFSKFLLSIDTIKLLVRDEELK